MVERDWFDAVQLALEGRRGHPRKDCDTKEALCRGRVLCAVCGLVMHVINAIGTRCYRCKSHHPPGRRNPRRARASRRVWVGSGSETIGDGLDGSAPSPYGPAFRNDTVSA
jgi:hypothetical protein